MIYPATFALAILFAQATRALPQPGDVSVTPATTSSSYLSTPSPSSSPYSSSSSAYPYSTPVPNPPADKNGTSYPSSSYPASCSCPSGTPYPPSQPPYTPSPPYTTPMPYPPADKNGTSYSPSYTSSSPYTTPMPYPPADKNGTSYPPSTPYPPSQPPYTPSSSYTPPKESYPPTTTMPYSHSPSKPSGTPVPGAPTTTLKATFDTTYDNKNGSLNSVACSNGANGLVGRFPTFGDVPSFPFIGGAFDIVWNSPNCGGCWSLTNAATGVSIHITAIDTAGAGFNIAQEAFVQLNGGQIGQGVVDVVATKVSPSVCGL